MDDFKFPPIHESDYAADLRAYHRWQEQEWRSKRRKKMGWLAWGFLSLCVGVALIWGLW